MPNVDGIYTMGKWVLTLDRSVIISGRAIDDSSNPVNHRLNDIEKQRNKDIPNGSVDQC